MNPILKTVILAIPYFFMVLGIGIYNRVNPELGGWPFFYWYQLLWIFIAALLTFAVYLAERNAKENGGAAS
ncbi:hypothetical protein GCM10007108_04000 [Thermogymnomonas acidicola]|uniref:DUF3311 domain-containing protein n=1 Tax=Thermogymnomonas acidicola TaxID=399579 RepID=A0AA37BQD1_9ARCH|nr:DUF3311 domain-containing protein [Thermogymnomonas acidicola]GGM69054.1 hypothetical protein GCM10007108_04000 [Thermogymnomonas acidicola]